MGLSNVKEIPVRQAWHQQDKLPQLFFFVLMEEGAAHSPNAQRIEENVIAKAGSVYETVTELKCLNPNASRNNASFMLNGNFIDGNFLLFYIEE